MGMLKADAAFGVKRTLPQGWHASGKIGGSQCSSGADVELFLYQARLK